MAAMLAAGGFGLAFPYVAGRVVDGAASGGITAVNLATVTLFLVLAMQAACSFLQSYWFSIVGESALADLRRDVYRRMIRLPLVFHAGHRIGELTSRLTADLGQIQEALVLVGPYALREATVLVGGVIMIFVTSVRLALVMVVSVPPLVVLAILFGRAIRRSAQTAQDRMADSSAIVHETLLGMTTVKAFTSERREEHRYSESLQTYLQMVFRGARWQAAFNSFVVFALFGSLVIVLWHGALLVRSGQLTAGQLMSFLLYTVYVSSAMRGCAELFAQVQRTLGATQRVRELLNEVPEDIDPAAGISILDPREKLRGEVLFDDVSFHYPGRPDVEVLRGVRLHALPGQRIALVGPSGAGKSTLISLLLGFYRPDGGQLLLDGRDIRGIPLYELRRQVAVVPQDVLLFGGTIAENIAYGRPDATPEEIVVVARRANAHDFLQALPDGYQTQVGERGMQLSGGQRQRIAIARALLRDPAILLLDEATSALDAESEALVLEALDTLMQGRTSLVIAHRLSTVRRADCIFVLQDGRTIESGTHEELITRPGGAYRTLSELQIDLH
jgi:ATP-binding cassette subfamily B protein